jgi:hypothetical protein
MYQRPFTSALAVTVAASWLLPSCMLEKRDDAEEYRQAVPAREAVAVAGPETDEVGDARTASAPGATRVQASAPMRGGDYAKWYGFTRTVRASVNLVTAAVLGSVWAIVHTEPSSVENGEAIWGPYTDALEPVSYRFRVTRVAEGEYDYALEGRPKASASERDYVTVLSGHGFGKRHELHGEGELRIDVDAARELDPFAHPGESGTVSIEHQLPRAGAQQRDALPHRISAQVTPDPAQNPESFQVVSLANADGTGSLRVDAIGDVDDSKATQLEDVRIDSRWRADGAGRADISIVGGDIPADDGALSAVECWGADFARSYYADSIDWAPKEGDMSACVYGTP